MTQKEFELQMQRLNSEYTKKSNEIARQKEDVNARKQDAFLEADDAFHAETFIPLNPRSSKTYVALLKSFVFLQR